MSPVELMALVLALAGGIKLLYILFNPKAWHKHVVKKAWGNASSMTMVGLVITGLSLYFLLGELSIVQIFAVMFFMSGLLMVGFAPYSKDLMHMAEKMVKDKKMMKKNGLTIAIWAVLIVWVLWSLLG